MHKFWYKSYAPPQKDSHILFSAIDMRGTKEQVFQPCELITTYLGGFDNKILNTMKEKIIDS